MFVTSRWFPLILALLQTALHLSLIGYSYWTDSRGGVDGVVDYIRRDLERPLFEEKFCADLVSHSPTRDMTLGLNPLAYIVPGMVLPTADGTYCAPTWRPKEDLIIAAFVAPVWFLVGLSMRRLFQRRWRRRAEGRLARSLLWVGLALLPLGLLLLLLGGALLFFTGEGGFAFVGLAFWLFYLATFAAERLRLGPFTNIVPRS